MTTPRPTTPTWHFTPMTPGELNVDPFEREFFATEVLHSKCDALVREVVQNALDAAAADDAPVRVRFRLGGLPATASERYLGPLWRHAEAALSGEAPLPDPDDRMRYLVVEDFGTRGLDGDPRQYEDTDPAPGVPRNDFFYFWRNVGRSQKETLDRGRWGLGKTVLAASSAVQAFFGLTRRLRDGRALLMGQAVLKIHRLADVRYRPYGYFGLAEQDLCLPVEDPGALDRFADDFTLTRRDEPGLSLVIPFPDREIGQDTLVGAVVRHYFHPLVSGKLAVTVEEASRTVRLDRDSLTSFPPHADRDELRRVWPLLELARWDVDAEPEARFELPVPPAGQRPRFEPEQLPADLVAAMRRRYDAGQRVAVDAGVVVQRQGGQRQLGRLRLLLERIEGNHAGEGHFVRQGITVANAGARRPRGARWLMVIDDAHLSTFLGDAENPAHTEWQRSSPKFKEKYRRGPTTLDYVRGLPRNLVSLLSRPAAAREPDLLRGVFSLGEDAAVTTPRPTRPTRGPATELTTGTVAGSGAGALGEGGTLRLERRKAGFKLAGTVTDGAPRHLRLRIAYEVVRGNPFQRYSPLDFTLDREPIAMQAEGVTVGAVAGNAVDLQVTGPQFELTVTGFDEHRDLRIKVDRGEDAP